QGTSYYRLKQTDYDGHYTYFHPISVFNKDKKAFVAYPNPSNGSNIRLNYSGMDLTNYKVMVNDITGKTIPSTIHPSDAFGELQLDINENYRTFGSMYIISAIGPNETVRQKIVIGKE